MSDLDKYDSGVKLFRDKRVADMYFQQSDRAAARVPTHTRAPSARTMLQGEGASD